MDSPQRTARDRASDADPEVRYRAVLELEPAAELDLLLARLADESWRVRKAAVERLCAVSDPRAIGGLLQELACDDNAGARNAAAEALARIGGPAIPAVLDRLKQTDRDVRKFAADILGEIRDRSTIPALVLALADADQNVRIAAAEALGKVGGVEASGALEEALASSDRMVQLAALEALAAMGQPPPVSILAPLAKDRFLRRSVLRLLGAHPGRSAMEIVVESLNDPARGTREAAFEALAQQLRRNPERSLAGLAQTFLPTLRASVQLAERARQTLGSGDALAVEGAAQVLGLIGGPEDAVALVEAAAEGPLRDAVLSAVQAMGAAAGPALVKALSRLTPEPRRVAVEALAKLRERSATPALVALVREGGDGERQAALEALGAIGDPQAIGPLAQMLGDEELAADAARALVVIGRAERVRVVEAIGFHLEPARGPGGAAAWAVRVVGSLGARDQLPLLKAAFRSEEAAVRLAAAEAASRLGDAGAQEMLRGALSDEDPEVRAGAARGLGAFASEQSLSALVAALGDREPAVAAAAAEALGALGDARAAGALEKALERGQQAPGTAEVRPAIAAVRALCRLRVASGQALAAAAAHADPEVVKEAVEAAASLPGMGELLLGAAANGRWDVRRAAAKAIAERGERALLAALVPLAERETDPLAAEAFAEAIRALEARPRGPELAAG